MCEKPSLSELYQSKNQSEHICIFMCRIRPNFAS